MTQIRKSDATIKIRSKSINFSVVCAGAEQLFLKERRGKSPKDKEGGWGEDGGGEEVDQEDQQQERRCRLGRLPVLPLHRSRHLPRSSHHGNYSC